VVGATSYTQPDRTAILSAVVEARSQGETPEKLRSHIVSSGAINAEVFEGREGMLVDSFHEGLVTGAEYHMLVPRHGVVRMLDRIHMLLGTGAEVLLFEQGSALGRSDGEALVRSLGADRVVENFEYLAKSLAAQGRGSIVRRIASSDETRTVITVNDCFECSSNESGRTACHFVRGYIAGNAAAIYRTEFNVEEVKCTLIGGDACEFLMEPKATPRTSEIGFR
jgi:predicted hydrocarbon binding protein